MPRVKSRDQKAPIVARAILEAAIASKDETALLLIFLASTGLRVSEALGTKIGEANGASSWHPDQPLVRVRTQQGKNGDDASLKSYAAWRDVELPLEVHEYLKQHANMGKPVYLCSGDTFIKQTDLAINVHDKVIQQILRHASVEVTRKHYIKTNTTQAESAMKRLDRAYTRVTHGASNGVKNRMSNRTQKRTQKQSQ